MAGAEFTLADIVFLYSADLASTVAKILFDMQPLADWPEANELLQRLGENPHVRTIARNREAARPAFVEAVKARLPAAAPALRRSP